ADVVVSGNYTVKVGVYNEAGELVKIINITQFSQPVNSIALEGSNTISTLNGANNAVTVYYGNVPIGVWDGTTSQGQPISNGTYYIKVDNIDNAGVVTSVTQQAVVSRVLAQVTIKIYNEAGEVMRQLYTYTDDLGNALINSVSLSNNVITPDSTGTQPGAVTMVDNQGVTLARWDGRADDGNIVSNGTYYMEFRVSEGNGEQTVIVKTISVIGHTKVTSVFVEPNVLTEQHSVATFQAPYGMSMSIRVYDVAGELVAKVQSSPGAGVVTWDASKLASGFYLAVVDLRDGAGHNQGQKILKLSVKH
ncbi:MAG TPA: hypothetical protein VJ873_03880, partial [bacterium]|nr:hypothetical protein [bacterium]